MNKESFAYVVYLIHACADKWHMLPSETYNILQESGCIETYLIPNFDVLHTQGTEYIVDDIKKYLNLRGVTI